MATYLEVSPKKLAQELNMAEGSSHTSQLNKVFIRLYFTQNLHKGPVSAFHGTITSHFSPNYSGGEKKSGINRRKYEWGKGWFLKLTVGICRRPSRRAIRNPSAL